MELFYSSTSPYARKVIVVAIETGLMSRIELINAKPHPVQRDQNVVKKNPLGKVPTLVTDDGQVIFDSRAICEYLDNQSGAVKVFPPDGQSRWGSLSQQSLADGILDAALLVRYETTLRPSELQWEAWKSGQWEKIDSAIAALETQAPVSDDQTHIGAIAVACALGYLDFRFSEFDWRAKHSKLANWLAHFEQRESLRLSRHYLQ